jgi:dihydroneopterin aldolase
MSLSIDVKGIKAYGKHGVYSEEKKEEQLFLVDVKLVFEGLKESQDSLEATINYEIIVQLIIDLIKKESFNLIETLAKKLLEDIEQLANERSVIKVIKGISVTVHKPETLLSQTTEDISVTASEEF